MRQILQIKFYFMQNLPVLLNLRFYFNLQIYQFETNIKHEITNPHPLKLIYNDLGGISNMYKYYKYYQEKSNSNPQLLRKQLILTPIPTVY